MNIFVDEAGTFVVPTEDKWSISCVGALVIPECFTNNIFQEFSKLKITWQAEDVELKGWCLSECQISTLVEILIAYDVIFQVTAIDMNTQSPHLLADHQLTQVAKFSKNLTPYHQKTLIDETIKLQEYLKDLTSQLYVQATCTFELLYNIIQKSTLYYSQRIPKELAEYYWYIDAKDKKIIPFERFWTDVVLMALQSKSFNRPFIQIDDADYSYFHKYCDIQPEAPEHLKKVVHKTSPFEFINTKNIYKRNLSFEQSHLNLGIQLVDMLTTTTRRAMNGKSKIQGWGSIGKLMTQSIGGHAIQLIDLTGEGPTYYSDLDTPPYWEVIAVTDRLCKRILKE